MVYEACEQHIHHFLFDGLSLQKADHWPINATIGGRKRTFPRHSSSLRRTNLQVPAIGSSLEENERALQALEVSVAMA